MAASLPSGNSSKWPHPGSTLIKAERAPGADSCFERDRHRGGGRAM